MWRIDPLLSSDCKQRPLLGNTLARNNRRTVSSMWTVPRQLLWNGAVNASTTREGMYFLRGPCRGVILKTTGVAIQLWNVNQRTMA
jgi:hypothetical protein